MNWYLNLSIATHFWICNDYWELFEFMVESKHWIIFTTNDDIYLICKWLSYYPPSLYFSKFVYLLCGVLRISNVKYDKCRDNKVGILNIIHRKWQSVIVYHQCYLQINLGNVCIKHIFWWMMSKKRSKKTIHVEEGNRTLA